MRICVYIYVEGEREHTQSFPTKDSHWSKTAVSTTKSQMVGKM